MHFKTFSVWLNLKWKSFYFSTVNLQTLKQCICVFLTSRTGTVFVNSLQFMSIEATWAKCAVLTVGVLFQIQPQVFLKGLMQNVILKRRHFFWNSPSPDLLFAISSPAADDRSEVDGSVVSMVSATSSSSRLLPPKERLREKAFQYCQRLIEQCDRSECVCVNAT